MNGIFPEKFDAENNVKYIYVKQSSELSAVLNLSKNDVRNITIRTTGLNNVITQMDINNNLHPVESNKYYSSSSVVNNNRFKYNLGEKEGIQNINLDYNIGSIPTSANSDANTDFYSYYNNLIGDIKVLVQCEVVNLAKGYQLETGDIVTFTDMPVEMFGTNFTTNTKFMIVETKRSFGQIIITAREVG